MAEVLRRRFGRAFKLALVRRMEAGESGTALAREFAIKRTILYRWRDAVRDGGEEALRDGPGRPTRADKHSMDLARGPAANANHLGEPYAVERVDRRQCLAARQPLERFWIRGGARKAAPEPF